MTAETVKNFFEQPGADRDNALVVTGNMRSESGATVALAGTTTLSGSTTVSGTMETIGAADLKTKLVTVAIGDVSTAGSVFVVPGVAGTIVGISNVIDAAITVADAVLTFEIGGVAVTNAAITIATAASAAGDVDQSTPSALNVITAAEAIEVVKDGGSTTTSLGVVTFEILPS